MVRKAEACGVSLRTFEDIIRIGKENRSGSPRTEPKPDDIYVISYTSGTTGDSKGVKLSHWNFLVSARAVRHVFDLHVGDAHISYLPYTHSYEQAMLSLALIIGLKIGFYTGNPLKLIEDCAALKPAIFPSVPRLYNKIYSALQARFNSVTGCKRWLLNRGLATK